MERILAVVVITLLVGLLSACGRSEETASETPPAAVPAPTESSPAETASAPPEPAAPEPDAAPEPEAAAAKPDPVPPATKPADKKPADVPDPTETVVVLETTQGAVAARFFPEKAPEHVRNFIEHCKSGLYEGTFFHRVIPGFMIQGGDPNTKTDPARAGQGGHSYKGPGTFLKAEFNDITHRRGILSMARSSDPNSAGSQFFIMVADTPRLDHQYTVFGQVIQGMDAVDKIVHQPGPPAAGGGANPSERQLIQKCRVEQWPVSKVRQMAGE